MVPGSHSASTEQSASQLNCAWALTSHFPPSMAIEIEPLALISALMAAEAMLQAACMSSSETSLPSPTSGGDSPRSVAMSAQATASEPFISPATLTRASTAALNASAFALRLAAQPVRLSASVLLQPEPSEAKPSVSTAGAASDLRPLRFLID